MCHVREAENFLGGSGNMQPPKILQLDVSEMLVPVFWGWNLQNSEGYKTLHRILILGEGLIWA